jgi:hypothetical protein
MYATRWQQTQTRVARRTFTNPPGEREPCGGAKRRLAHRMERGTVERNSPADEGEQDDAEAPHVNGRTSVVRCQRQRQCQWRWRRELCTCTCQWRLGLCGTGTTGTTGTATPPIPLWSSSGAGLYCSPQSATRGGESDVGALKPLLVVVTRTVAESESGAVNVAAYFQSVRVAFHSRCRWRRSPLFLPLRLAKEKRESRAPVELTRRWMFSSLISAGGRVTFCCCCRCYYLRRNVLYTLRWTTPCAWMSESIRVSCCARGRTSHSVIFRPLSMIKSRRSWLSSPEPPLCVLGCEGIYLRTLAQ